MKESLKELFIKLNLDGFAPYLDNTIYLIFFFVILTFILFYLISFVLKLFSDKKESSTERKKPSLNEIIDKEEVKTSDDNEFVDVLVAIEEEMAAVRELYVGGYISKGVYISETDRLYEKAKIFGL
tara:strand:+ start:614 stop:991 length:378 start_codon:yes stop_codon:yes gene_type:complete